MARALGAEIVSVDSMVVYRGMDVGHRQARRRPSGPRSRTTCSTWPTRPSRSPSAEYQALARRAARATIERAGHAALLVGGSGLYFRAVVDGLEFPATDAATRAPARGRGRGRRGRTRSTAGSRTSTPRPPAGSSRPTSAGPFGPSRSRPSPGGRSRASPQAWERYPADAVRVAGRGHPTADPARPDRAPGRAMLPGLLAETRGAAGRRVRRLPHLDAGHRLRWRRRPASERPIVRNGGGRPDRQADEGAGAPSDRVVPPGSRASAGSRRARRARSAPWTAVIGYLGAREDVDEVQKYHGTGNDFVMVEDLDGVARPARRR